MKKGALLTLSATTLGMCYGYGDTYQEANLKKGRPAVDNNAVVLAHPPYAFVADFTALILQPGSSNLYFAAEADPLPVLSPDWKIHEIHPGYDFGFDVGIGGVFHSTNSTLSLDWEHFHSINSHRKNVDPDHRIGPFFEIGPDASPYKKAHGHAFFSFDEVSLDYGVFVDFGSRLRTNFFAGVSYTKIRQILHTKFSSLDGNTVRTIRPRSSFWGVGPQLGIDFSYCIAKGLHFIGAGVASLYVGTMKNHTRYKAGSPELVLAGFTPPNKQRTTVTDRTQVVPGLEGQLGLSYSYLFKRHWMIAIKAGYMAQIYLNAIQSTDIASQVDTPPGPSSGGVYVRSFVRTLSNFALAGPFAGIDLAF